MVDQRLCTLVPPLPSATLQAVRQRMWPQQAGHPGFINYLQRLYDHTQLEAIEV